MSSSNDYRLKRVGKDVFVTVSRQLFVAAVAMGTAIVIARYLGPQGNGIYNLVIFLPTLIFTMSSFGVSNASVYHISRKDYRVEDVVQANLRLSLVLGALGMLVGAAAVIFFKDRLFPGIPEHFLLFSLAAVPMLLLLSFWQSVFQGLRDYQKFNSLAIVPQTALFVLVAGTLWWFRGSIDVAIAAYVLSYAVGIVMAVFLVRQWLKIPSTKEVRRRYYRECLTYGWQAHVSNVVALLNRRISLAFVNGLSSASAAGIYAAATQMREALWLLPQAVSLILLPLTASMEAEEEKRRELTGLLCRFVAVFTTFACGAVLIACPFFVPLLFGDKYQDVPAVFGWLLPGIVGNGVGRVITHDLAGRGRVDRNMSISVVLLTITIGGNYLFIPWMGLKGAAIAESLAGVVNLVCKLAIYQSITGVSWQNLILPKRNDVALIKKFYAMVVQKFSIKKST